MNEQEVTSCAAAALSEAVTEAVTEAEAETGTVAVVRDRGPWP